MQKSIRQPMRACSEGKEERDSGVWLCIVQEEEGMVSLSISLSRLSERRQSMLAKSLIVVNGRRRGSQQQVW